METFGVCTAILMLAALYSSEYRYSVFTAIQTAELLVWPLQKWMNYFHPVTAWYMWHDLNKFYILCNLVMAVYCKFPAVSALLLIQTFLKLIKYENINTDREYFIDTLYCLHKFLDPVICLWVVWYILRQRRNHEPRTKTASSSHAPSRTEA